jgi:CheY-like chemotaxis protein
MSLLRYANSPIIAMTTNSFNEDRQASIDAGMNDHLSKPVVQEKLFGRLPKWL